MKQLLRAWEKEYPGRVETVFNSLQRVTPSHLLDRKLFDFPAISATGIPAVDGDKAFDAEDFSSVPSALFKLQAAAE